MRAGGGTPPFSVAIAVRPRLTHGPSMRVSTKGTLPALFLCLLAVACGGSSDDAAPESTPESAPAEASGGAFTVEILRPSDGSFQEEHEVVVWLRTTVPIVPAGDMTPGTGHHHLYLDADLGDMTAPVPTVPGSIVHMGNAATEYTFEDVGSGPHRLIAVVADGAHIPLQPLVVDTVTFTVE